jgi:hypothetical protein
VGLVARPVFKTGLRPCNKAVAVRFPRIPLFQPVSTLGPWSKALAFSVLKADDR